MAMLLIPYLCGGTIAPLILYDLIASHLAPLDLMSPFNFDHDYVLETNCVRLIPLSLDHYAQLLPYALQQPDIWHYSLVSAAGSEGMQQYITTALAARQAQREYPFVVFDKQTEQYAGSTRYYDMVLDQQTLEIGYTWYAAAFRGTGLNKHCKWLLLSFAFEQLGIERVGFRADANNARSIAAMKSIGCTPEGILRHDRLKSDGGRRSSIVLSILRDEWFGGIKQQLHEKIGV